MPTLTLTTWIRRLPKSRRGRLGFAAALVMGVASSALFLAMQPSVTNQPAVIGAFMIFGLVGVVFFGGLSALARGMLGLSPGIREANRVMWALGAVLGFFIFLGAVALYLILATLHVFGVALPGW